MIDRSLVVLCILRLLSWVMPFHVSLLLQKVVRNQSHINPIAEELSQRFTVDGYVIKDKVDAILLSRIIEGFGHNIASNDKVVSASINNILSLYLSTPNTKAVSFNYFMN